MALRNRLTSVDFLSVSIIEYSEASTGHRNRAAVYRLIETNEVEAREIWKQVGYAALHGMEINHIHNACLHTEATECLLMYRI